ncbi:MAG: hypothetical protein ACE5EM_13255, partial [Sphingomonadales bacterium]
MKISSFSRTIGIYPNSSFLDHFTPGPYVPFVFSDLTINPESGTGYALNGANEGHADFGIVHRRDEMIPFAESNGTGDRISPTRRGRYWPLT